MSSPAPLGIIVNPHSGRDARRLLARAGTSTIEDKRNQVTRIVVGAAAAGCRRALLSPDAFRIVSGAIAGLALPIECKILDIPTTGRSLDSQHAAIAMQEAGCGALVALGGDGTSRAISLAWPDVNLLPVSTGTNNVFPYEVEATVAGAAAGLVAAGRLTREAAGAQAKVLRVRTENHPETMALIDAGLLVNDDLGSLLQADPEKLASILLTRAEPESVGLSPIGGLLLPCYAEDDFGVLVRTQSGHSSNQSSHMLRAPISPGLYATLAIDSVDRIELGQDIEWRGPGLIAFDGDREIMLAEDERAWLRVVRDGPWVIDPRKALRAASQQGLFRDMGTWHDHRGSRGMSCC